MRRALRSRSVKKIRIVTPGCRTVWHFKVERPGFPRCPCGAKLNRPRLLPVEIKKLSKSERRPQRPYPELCPTCARERLKRAARGV